MADLPWYTKYTIVLAGGVLTVYVMVVAKSTLIPLLFAGFLGILLTPVSARLERYGVPRVVAALLTLTLAVAALVGLGFFFYTQLSSFVEDVDLIRARIEEMMARVEPLAAQFGLGELIDFRTLGATAIGYVGDNATDLVRGLAGAASTITAALLVPVFIFFVLIGRTFLRDFLLQAFGTDNPARVERVAATISKVKQVVQRYITGVLIVIGILAILNSLLLLTIGVDHALFFAVFAAMLNVVPFLGPIFGSVLPVLYALLTMDSLIYPLLVLGGFYVIQLFESNLFTPTIVGSQVSMNAMVTLFLLFIGAQIWGLAGLILFIPMGAIIKVVCDEVDSLKPLGFLLGRMPTDQEQRKGPLARRISEIPSHIDRMEAKRGASKEGATHASGGEPSGDGNSPEDSNGKSDKDKGTVKRTQEGRTE